MVALLPALQPHNETDGKGTVRLGMTAPTALRMGIIYRASCGNGAYIGRTIQRFWQRRKGHYRDARRGSATPFARALRKYGRELWEWGIVCRAPEFALGALEITAIQWFAPRYNATAGGDGGESPSAEVRAQISATLKAKGIRPPLRGKPRPPRKRLTRAEWLETLRVAGLRRRGRRMPDAHRAAIGASKRGVPIGPMPAAHRAAISAGKLAKRAVA